MNYFTTGKYIRRMLCSGGDALLLLGAVIKGQLTKGDDLQFKIYIYKYYAVHKKENIV